MLIINVKMMLYDSGTKLPFDNILLYTSIRKMLPMSLESILTTRVSFSSESFSKCTLSSTSLKNHCHATTNILFLGKLVSRHKRCLFYFGILPDFQEHFATMLYIFFTFAVQCLTDTLSSSSF